MSEQPKVTPIAGRNRIEYEQKIAEKLKAEYKVGETVDVAAFGQKYGVRQRNVRKVVEDIQKEYNLLLPVVGETSRPVVKS
jgi:hypothetical protein